MNILIISHFYPPNRGGIETAAFNLARNFYEKFRQNVVVLTSKVPGATEKYRNENGVHVYRMKSLYTRLFEKFIPQIASFGFEPLGPFMIKKLIKQYDIQIIHLHGRFFPISLIGLFLNRIIFKRKIYLTVHGRLKFGFSGVVERLFDKTMMVKIYSKVNKIFTVSNSLRNRFLKFGLNPSQILTIHNGIDFSLFYNKPKKEFLRKRFNIESDSRIILFFGRLEKQKGLKYLLHAISELKDRITNTKFIIWGDGSLKSELMKLSRKLKIHDLVSFSDAILKDEDVPYVYNGADFFCLPSVHEGFPIAMVEAMASGLPIIASRTEGIPEAIKDKENGFLFNVADSKDLADKLLKSLEISENRLKMIKSINENKAKHDFSWYNISKRILKVYTLN
jgi:glycosyltransferase involved in cell wall biosynthesis